MIPKEYINEGFYNKLEFIEQQEDIMNISVVIPMYNREKTIGRAIRSILQQTFLPMEIIVVDDCSVDGSVNMVREIRKEDKRIKLICLKKNSGAQAARNYGIKEARGEWILLLDSDDELLYNALEIYRDVVEENIGYDVYYGDYYRRENDKRKYVNCRMKKKEGVFFPDMLWGAKVLFQGMLIRKSALEDIKLLDENVPAYQEWDTNIRLSLKHKYFYIHRPLFIYNIYLEGTISTDLKRSVRGFQYVVLKNWDLFLNNRGMVSILSYYEGMYRRYKRCDDYKQYLFFYIWRILCITSTNKICRNLYLKMFGYVWRRKAKKISQKQWRTKN